MPEVKGVELFTGHSGMRYKRDDVLLVSLAKGTTTAGLFTQNQVVGAPIPWGRKVLAAGGARGLVVNSGIANVFTGKQGAKAVEATAQAAAKKLKCNAEDVHVCSTGVIGEPIDADKLGACIGSKLKPASWEAATNAIGTTDTFPKAVTRTAMIGAEQITINGIIKGSGMIEPNMATMLGYVFTDAAIPAPILQAWLNEAADASYHCLTVDGDTSTSDTVLVFATGQVKHWEIEGVDFAAALDLKEKLIEVHQELAKLVARDGEGITKLLTVECTGAANADDARKIAKAIANSPLVKTAVAGEDPNWGRLAGAAGNAGVELNQNDVSLWIGPHKAGENGVKCPTYVEADAAAYMQEREVTLRVDIGAGDASAEVWTCDLTHGYISINADYRS